MASQYIKPSVAPFLCISILLWAAFSSAQQSEPQAPPAAEAETAPEAGTELSAKAGMSCSPQCTRGQICTDGRCVGACNPACDEGQICLEGGRCVNRNVSRDSNEVAASRQAEARRKRRQIADGDKEARLQRRLTPRLGVNLSLSFANRGEAAPFPGGALAIAIRQNFVPLLGYQLRAGAGIGGFLVMPVGGDTPTVTGSQSAFGDASVFLSTSRFVIGPRARYSYYWVNEETDAANAASQGYLDAPGDALSFGGVAGLLLGANEGVTLDASVLVGAESTVQVDFTLGFQFGSSPDSAP